MGRWSEARRRRPVLVTATFASLVSLAYGVWTLIFTQLYLVVSRADHSQHAAHDDAWRMGLAEFMRWICLVLTSPLELAHRLVGDGDAMFVVAIGMVGLVTFCLLQLVPLGRGAGSTGEGGA